MGIEKAEIKIGMAKELGRKYAEMAQAQSEELIRLDGEKRAYKKVAAAFESYFKAVDDDLDKGNFNLKEPLSIAKEVKKALSRALAGVDNLHENVAALTYTVHGRLDGLVKSTEIVQKVAESEEKKIQAVIEAAVESPDRVAAGSARPSERPPGIRPGPSIAAQRRAEGAQGTPQGSPAALGETATQGAVRSTRSGLLKEGGSAKKATKKATKKTSAKTEKKNA